MGEQPEVLYFVIDSIDMDEGSAFVYLDAFKKFEDPRLNGRFGRDNGKVYLETYNSYDLQKSDRERAEREYGEFESIYIEAPNRRTAVIQLVRQLGYTSKVEIKNEKE